MSHDSFDLQGLQKHDPLFKNRPVARDSIGQLNKSALQLHASHHKMALMKDLLFFRLCIVLIYCEPHLVSISKWDDHTEGGFSLNDPKLSAV